MKKTIVLAVVAILSIGVLRAQRGDDASFIVMSSHGYASSEFFKGTGHMNTALYAPSKLWAYGVDLGFARGSDTYRTPYVITSNSVFRETKVEKLAFSPSIYLFPLNRDRHQIYLGVSVGVGYTDYTNLLHEIDAPSIGGVADDSDGSYSWSQKDEFGVAFGLNSGYNYKIGDNWMVGVRAYFEHNLESTIMGLATVGVRF